MLVVRALAFTFIGRDTELNLVLTCSSYTSDDPLYTAEFTLSYKFLIQNLWYCIATHIPSLLHLPSEVTTAAFLVHRPALNQSTKPHQPGMPLFLNRAKWNQNSQITLKFYVISLDGEEVSTIPESM